MDSFEFEAALSFAGEDRPFVDEVAKHLTAAGVTFFYDALEANKLWGEDLAVHLDEVYRKRARYAVPFISRHYAEKDWPRLEFRSALARSVEEKGAYILPVRFDDTELPGLRPTIGYLDARTLSPAEIAAHIIQKLGRTASDSTGPSKPASRLPRVVPLDFNPIAEAESALEKLKAGLLARTEELKAQGFVVHQQNRDGRSRVRVLRQGEPVYALDIWIGDNLRDDELGFCDVTGRTHISTGSMTATGKIAWDLDRGHPVVKITNFSLLGYLSQTSTFTPDELVDAIWEEACRRIESTVRSR